MAVLQFIVTLIPYLILLFIGAFCLFFSKKVKDIYIYMLTWNGKFSNNKFIKWEVNRIERLSQKKWFIINLRICGVAMILMALMCIYILLSSIFQT